MRARFPLGQIVATNGAIAALATSNETPADLLARHQIGDWGDLDDEDKRLNEEALVDGSRIFSAYILKDGHTKVWCITEAGRGSTCLLLPEEY
jgi:hypothetical protein